MSKDDELLGIVRKLMFCENMGDVHDLINTLLSQLGMSEFEGNFIDGWTDEDLERAGLKS